jgi:hypothetical protein
MNSNAVIELPTKDMALNQQYVEPIRSNLPKSSKTYGSMIIPSDHQKTFSLKTARQRLDNFWLENEAEFLRIGNNNYNNNIQYMKKNDIYLF